MKRWNGWGEENITYKIHKPAKAFLLKKIKRPKKIKSKKLEEFLETVISDSKIKNFPFTSKSKFYRLTHSYGQSFPDWLKFKMGLPFKVVDAVAFPKNDDEILEIVEKAKREKTVLIPYGGGTSVVGHLEVNTDRPTISIDLSNLNKIIRIDEVSNIAEIEAGISGPNLEKQLNLRGYTMGHFPQSFEFSTLGGWIATKSSGQFSNKYGKIEEMTLGFKLISPTGIWHIEPYVKSATGMDIKEIVLGSEGRIGIISKAYVKIHKIPELEIIEGAFLEEDEAGVETVRELSSSGIPFSMLRLSFSKETEVMLSLISHKWWYPILTKYLSLKKLPKNKCMLIFASSGNRNQVKLSIDFAKNVIKKMGGVNLGKIAAKSWLKDRFKTPYLRNTLWELGLGVETLETSTTWSNVLNLTKKIEESLNGTLAFSHLSHTYHSGSSIYTTFIFALSEKVEENYKIWSALKSKASKTIVENGGTISHHHGVGLYHKPYLNIEKKEKGINSMRKVIDEFDPYNIMNPGKLVDN